MLFRFKKERWEGLTAEKAVDMISHLPPTVTDLIINDASFGLNFMDAVINHLTSTSNLRWLRLNDTVAGGEEGPKAGTRLAKAVAANKTMEYLYLCDTDLMDGDNAEDW